MKKALKKGALLGIVVLAVLMVVGSAGAAPPMQDGPGGFQPRPPGPSPWWGGEHDWMPQPWGPPALEEEPASGTAVRIDFEVSGQNARPGLYEIRYPDGAVLTSWHAYGGAVDSGWIGDLELPRKTVWVDVVYVGGPGQPSVKLHILNPAPSTEYGWIGQGMSHAIEVAWPDMPIHPADTGPVGPDGQPWGPEGWVGRSGGMMGGMPGGMMGGMPGGPGGPGGIPGAPYGMPAPGGM